MILRMGAYFGDTFSYCDTGTISPSSHHNEVVDHQVACSQMEVRVT